MTYKSCAKKNCFPGFWNRHGRRCDAHESVPPRPRRRKLEPIFKEVSNVITVKQRTSAFKSMPHNFMKSLPGLTLGLFFFVFAYYYKPKFKLPSQDLKLVLKFFIIVYFSAFTCKSLYFSVFTIRLLNSHIYTW
uniref:Uncharacterized protein n=1 Tax=Oryza brachyantha TaxID=4533 RepID=J3MTP3_ORYBR